MADAVAVATVNKQWADSAYHVYGTLAITVSPAVYVIGGITLNMNQADIKASRTPLQVLITGIAGYIYEYVAGADNSTGKVMIRAQTNAAAEDAALGELAASAIPSGVSGDTINFEAVWRGML